MPGPCTWPVDYAGCALPPTYPAEDTPERDRWESLAADLLWAWTGRSLGVCGVTVELCRTSLLGASWGSSARGWGSVLIDGQWYGVGCGTCTADACTCRPTAVTLPGPVQGVGEVRFTDDIVISPDTYRVEDGRRLVRTDGSLWPTRMTVTYRRGAAVPDGGQVAAGRLALELWRASCGDGACQLPRRVQSITRQDVTVTMLDDFDATRTGIWVIDSWVASVTRAAVGPRVYFPDARQTARRVTWGV